MKPYSDVHHPQSPPGRERKKKISRHPENTRQLLRAAGERNHPLTHACTVHSHNCCKTALFFHDPSSRKKQRFVRRKVFIQQGITCVYPSLSLSHESTWSGPGFHVVRTAGNRRKFSCTALAPQQIEKRCCCSLSKLDKFRTEQTASCTEVTVE